MKLEAQTHCEAFWRGKTRHFALALSDGFIHFWEPDSAEFRAAPEEWVCCAGTERGDVNKPLPDRLTRAFATGHYGRRICLSDQLTVWVRADGFAFIQVATQRKRIMFFAELEQYVFTKPTSQWIAELEQRVRNYSPGYDAFAEALAEHNITFAWGKETRVQLANGNDEELARIAELIFQLEPAWIEDVISGPKNESSASVRLLLHPSKALKLDFGGWDKFPCWNSTPHPRHELWQVWADWFAPSIDKEHHKQELEDGRCLFEISFSPQSFFDDFDWENNQPAELTQHEQLEIRLQLRDWLRDRVGLSDERITQLLN